MKVMTAQPPLGLVPDTGGVPIGAAAALVEDETGGRVFLHGELCLAWDGVDETLRRLAAVQLVRIKAAHAVQVAAAFGVDPQTLRRWTSTLTDQGMAALSPAKPGPKGPSRLTSQVVADIRARRAGGASLRAIAAAVGVSTDSVRRALPATTEPTREAAETTEDTTGAEATGAEAACEAADAEDASGQGSQQRADLPVLPPVVDRTGERVAARFGLLERAVPVFAPAARVPLAGLLLAIPGLVATGLLPCAATVFGVLPNGFYGLDTMLVEGVLRALAGQPRAEGATRIDPAALGRVLGLDRAPEVKTIRRKITTLAGTGKAEQLLAAMARAHVDRLDATDPPVAAVFYVDGHVRAYTGTAKIAKTHNTRLRFPGPATVETWVCDAAGDPVLVVMAEPGASLAGELARLLPDLRAAVGDDRRVLVGFDRGGWSPALFAHMAGAGFDVLTWRKGATEDVAADLFTDVTHVDEHGRTHTWTAADTTVDLPTGAGDEVFTMRQVTRADPGHGKRSGPRQLHILTTRPDLDAGAVIYRMGSRWRQENYFRYARMHFDLDSHDCYTTTGDDPDRSVPNPAKKQAHQHVLTTRTHLVRVRARTDADLLTARAPAPGQQQGLVTNTDYNRLTGDLRAAEAALDQAQATHRDTAARLPLSKVHPGQQVLETQTKLITHAIRIAAFNTATALARAVHVHTGYARANHEAHTLIRDALTGSGDIDPTIDGVLTVRLDPMSTPRATAAISQLCQHLTATDTRYPGTDLVLRYEVKPHH